MKRDWIPNQKQSTAIVMAEDFKHKVIEHIKRDVRADNLRSIMSQSDFEYLNGKQKNFAFMSSFQTRTRKAWAEYYEVAIQTIDHWQSNPKVKRLQDQFRMNTFKFMQEIALHLLRRSFEVELEILDTPSFHPDVLNIKLRTALKIQEFLKTGNINSSEDIQQPSSIINNFFTGEGKLDEKSLSYDEIKKRVSVLDELNELRERKVNE